MIFRAIPPTRSSSRRRAVMALTLITADERIRKWGKVNLV